MLYLATNPNQVNAPRELFQPLPITVFDDLDCAIEEVASDLIKDEYFLGLDSKSLREASLEWVREVD